MIRIPIGLVAAGLLSLLVGCASHPQVTDKVGDAQRIEAFENDVRELATALNVPGVSLQIVRDGSVIATRAFGVAQGNADEAFTANTALRIASVTRFASRLYARTSQHGLMNKAGPALKPSSVC